MVVVTAYRNYEDVEKYCHVAHFEELKENKYNVNVPRYVDISEAEEEIDIQVTIDEVKKLEKERQEAQMQVNAILEELGFRVYISVMPSSTLPPSLS